MTTLKLASTPAGFEPGAYVAADAPTIAAPLNSHPGVDHLAAVEERRLQMLTENHQKQNALRERAADLRRQAHALGGEILKKTPEANNLHEVEGLRQRANHHLDEARRLLGPELATLEAERVAIGGGTHPTIFALNIAARNRVDQDRAAERAQVANNLEAARAAFRAHLIELATVETFALAQALADATADPGDTVRALLAARSKAVA